MGGKAIRKRNVDAPIAGDDDMAVDVVALLSGAGISGAFALAGNMLGWWKKSGITEAELATRIDALKLDLQTAAKIAEKDGGSFNQALKDAIIDLRGVTMNLARMSSSQEQINLFTSKTVEAITRTQETHAHMLNELKTSISVLKEILEREGRDDK